MLDSTLAIIIVAITFILYTIPQIPLAVTTVLAMLAMAITGIISYADAFSGFSANATLLVAGMMIIGQALFTTGVANKLGKSLFRFTKGGNKGFIPALIIVVVLLSVFLNGALVAAAFMPILDVIASQSNGKISRKHTYFPLGVATIFGNNLTAISASSTITASGLLVTSGYEAIPFWGPTQVNLPSVVLMVIFYSFFGYRLQKQWFSFDEVPAQSSEESQKGETEDEGWTWRMTVSIIVMIGVIIAMIVGFNFGAAALLGSALLVLLRCIDEKTAFRSVNWSVIIIIAGAIGFSNGITQSGAGEKIARFVLDISGPIGKSPFGICVLFFLIASILSNVGSDNATVAMLVPISIAIAQTFAIDPLPYVLAISSGAKVAVATPISVAPMTMVQVVGYRFKDYVRMGGLANLTGIVAGSIVLYILYF